MIKMIHENVNARVVYKGNEGTVKGFNVPRGQVWIRWDNPLCRLTPRVPVKDVYSTEDYYA